MMNQLSDRRLKIAVVGGGVAGVTASHILQRKHDVTIFEKNDYIGGHTNTILIQEGTDAGSAIDTGFIVLNDQTYPTFHRLLKQLKAPVRNSDMSFGFYCEKTGLQYCGNNFNTLFAQRKNLFSLSHWKMLSEIVRFGNVARNQLEAGIAIHLTLGDFVQQNHFSPVFIENYLLPMGAAIWSTPCKEMLRFPAQAFLDFFNNHGLLALKPPQWQTVVGGSYAYIKQFLKKFNGRVCLNHQTKKIVRHKTGTTVVFENADPQKFDYVVLASHADESFSLLDQPTVDENRLLRPWKYVKNTAVLHTDEQVMPPNHRAWASWNYKREDVEGEGNVLSMTYHMNRLQGLKTNNQYFVTLNSQKPIKPESVIKTIQYTHPLYDFDSIKTQQDLHQLNGSQNTYFCGSYFGYGFHEDAVKSGVQVARLFGLEL